MVISDGQIPENNVIDWSSMSEIAQEVIFSLGLYLLIQQSVTGVSSGHVEPVDMLALYALLVQLQKQLSTLGDSFRRSLRYWVGSHQLFSLIRETPTTVDIPDASELRSRQGHVRFRNVEFAYGTKPVLRGVSFDCRCGEITVFVGKSGAGKSPIRKLIFREYLAQDGYIRIDGQDIREVTQESLRCHIGIVPQNPVLLRRTIVENLRFARDGIQDREIYDISQSLGFHDTFHELGYETNVSGLSVGQKMMVAITMIMIKGSRIILLDEATAAFDPKTEKVFHRAIETLKSLKTVIMIA
jgi:ATP-binding cassette subfamily B protein